MTIINAGPIVGNSIPVEEGENLGQFLLDHKYNFDSLEVDLRQVSPKSLISAFFTGFLQRIREKNPGLLYSVRQIKWITMHQFQLENILRWTINYFKPDDILKTSNQIAKKKQKLQIIGESSIGEFTNEEKLQILNEVEKIVERRKQQSQLHNCLFCNKSLESALPGGKSFQPYAGGEVHFEFCFGSTKFDKYMHMTKYSAYICDDCAEKYVPKMTEHGSGIGRSETGEDEVSIGEI